MRIGILGGAFNPPHLGHIALAKDISKSLNLNKVFFIPTNISPHKNNAKVSPKSRMDMVELAISGEENFETKDYEIKREGTSYTIDTIRQLKKDYPEDEFYLMVGSELANAFCKWKNFKKIKELAKIIIGQRKSNLFKNSQEPFLELSITQIDTCSSQIRELVKKGESIRELVNNSVAEYIQKHKLYEGVTQ